MFCPQCGNEIKTGKFCMNCGYKLPFEVEAENDQATEKVQINEEVAPEKIMNKRELMITKKQKITIIEIWKQRNQQGFEVFIF